MKKRVLFVGHSDTRVVPLCAAVMKYLCINKGITNMEFKSSGFWAVEGQRATENVITAAGEVGIDLSVHKSHYVTLDDLQCASLIIPQDAMIARGVASALNNNKKKIYRPMDVYDPSNLPMGAFRQSRNECVSFCEKLFKKLVNMEKTREKIMKAIEYRPVTPEEAPLVYELEELCFSHPWTLANIESEIQKENGIFIGAFYEDKMVGYASCYLVEDTAFMNNVGVHPDYRGFGIGEALMIRLEALAAERGIFLLCLEVRSKNTVAIGMYKKLGYEKKGSRRFFYRDPLDDADIMNKLLKDLPEDNGIIWFNK